MMTDDEFFITGALKYIVSTPISNTALPININEIAKPNKNTIIFC
jgi:hypothetical protein